MSFVDVTWVAAVRCAQYLRTAWPARSHATQCSGIIPRMQCHISSNLATVLVQIELHLRAAKLASCPYLGHFDGLYTGLLPVHWVIWGCAGYIQ